MTSPDEAMRHETGTDKLLVEVAGHIATVTFNNPAKRNACRPRCGPRCRGCWRR